MRNHITFLQVFAWGIIALIAYELLRTLSNPSVTVPSPANPAAIPVGVVPNFTAWLTNFLTPAQGTASPGVTLPLLSTPTLSGSQIIPAVNDVGLAVPANDAQLAADGTVSTNETGLLIGD